MVPVFLQAAEIRRLLCALVSEFQGRRVASGAIPSSASLEPRLMGGNGAATVDEIDRILLDEANLGLDSLALLDLILEVNRFFNLSDSGVEDYLFLQRSIGEWVVLIARHFEMVGPNAKITFRTSGSTGPSGSTTKTAHCLMEEIRTIRDTMPWDRLRTARVLCAVAPQHIYGFLWGVLLPAALDIKTVDCFRSVPSSLGRISCEGDIVIATPYIWEKCASFAARFAGGCIGICSGGPSSVQTWDAARQIGLEQMVEIFGSTETGGVGYRMAADTEYRLLQHLSRSGDQVVRTSDRSALVLQDRLQWIDERCFHVLGRTDKVVQIAGTNVNMTDLQSRLAALDAVDDVAVRYDGQALKAFIVLGKVDKRTGELAVFDALKRLPAPARPARIDYGADLPRTETGKLCDW